MKTQLIFVLAAVLAAPAARAQDSDFLSHPELLAKDPRFGDDMVYLAPDIEERGKNYMRVMVDEPVIFIAPDSPYGGFKPSDIAAVADMMRQSFAAGLGSEPVSFGKVEVVDQAGEGTLYLRLALKDIYIRKNKRGLFSYTPVGAVVHGVSTAASETIDKTTLVEMTAEIEAQDSLTNEVLFAMIMDRGQRKDKKEGVDEDAADWEITGAIAETMGRRVACRLDNARKPEDQQRDCIAEIPVSVE